MSPDGEPALVGTMILVGRERELTELVDALRAGRGEVFLIVGEPGIGKTSLADACTEIATREGARVAWGRAWEAGDAPAYYPWAQIARSLGFELPAAPDGAMDPSRSRFLFFEQVLAELEAACARGPAMLVFDDLHAADTASLLLLSFVVRERRRLRMLVLGTYRDAEARADPETESSLRAIAREGTFLRLGRLTQEDVRELASSTPGLAADPRALDEIYRITEGHPLFVREALRLIASRPRGSGGNIVLPDDARGTIRSRLGLLDERTRSLLAAAAVVGREADLDLLTTIAGTSVVDIEGLAAPAARAGILEEPVDRRLRFTHVLLRDELYRALPATERARLHGRVADALALRRGRSAPELGELAHHRTLAVTDGDVDLAVAATITAAEAELDGLAFEDATARLTRATAMFATRVAPARLAELHALATVAQMRAGRVAEGKSEALRAADIARSLGDADLLARAALAFGAEFTPGYVDPKLVELLEEALARMTQAGTMRAMLLARLAAARQPAPDPRLPIAMAEEAIAIAREAGGDDALRSVLHSALAAMATLGHPRVRRPLGEEMLELSSRAGDRVQVWRCHVRLALDCFELGDLAAAEQHLAAHERLAAEFREDHYRGPALLQRALFALYRGDFAGHERFIGEARVLSRNQGMLFFSSVWHTLLRHVIAEDWLAAEEGLSTVTEMIRQVLPSIGAAPFCAFIAAWIRCRQGDVDEARRLMDQDLGPRPELIRRFFALSGETMAAVGSDAERELALEIVSERADTVTMADMVGSTPSDHPLRVMGLLHASLGRVGEGIDCLERAVSFLERTGGQAFLPRVRRELEALRARAGEEREPRDPARRAPPPDRSAASVEDGGLRLERRGDAYEVTWRGQRAFLGATRGIELLAALVARPDVEVLALELEAGQGAAELDRGSAGGAIDERALRAYRARAEDLRETIEEATRFGDRGRAERARSELERIGEELARSVGLGGRPREQASAAERARINVQRHLKKAMVRIAQEIPDLGKHLEWAVRTGTYCVFRTK